MYLFWKKRKVVSIDAYYLKLQLLSIITRERIKKCLLNGRKLTILFIMFNTFFVYNLIKLRTNKNM